MAQMGWTVNLSERPQWSQERSVLRDPSRRIRTVLQSAFESRMKMPRETSPALRQALDSVLARSGAMIRPQVAYRAATAYGLDVESALDLAVALEYFHTASLIFDDLPCMDDAATRRGGACVHLRHGESGAILAALALINRAYALAWKAASQCLPSQQGAALAYLERQLGVCGLLHGQSLDLNYRELPHTLQAAERVARGKTVPLIALALAWPAILQGAPPRQVQLLERISLLWGLAYQIVDDLKDVLRPSAETGKTTERDCALGRPNMALLLGVPAAVERLASLMSAGDRTLERLCVVNPSLSFLRGFRGLFKSEFNLLLERAGAVPIDRGQ